MEKDNAGAEVPTKECIEWVTQELCVLCMLPKRDPKFVPCGHSFCENCATQIIILNTSDTHPICPLCPLVWMD